MKLKRKLQRPWGTRRNGGWVIQVEELIKNLKDGDVAEFGKLQVGARQLRQLIGFLRFPDEELLIKSNGQLEVQNIKRIFVKNPDGTRRCNFRKPKLAHSFRLEPNAWVPDKAKVVLVIKPRKF